MKLNKIIVIALLISTTFVLAGCGLTKKKSEPVQEATSIKTVEDEPMMDKEKVMEIPEGAIAYTINANSQASYQVNKVYFGKPSVLVKGTTKSVTGEGYANFDTQNFALEAEIDLYDLTTDSEKRDSDIQPLFGEQKANVKLVSIEGQIEQGKNFTTSAILAITINGKTQEVPFEIEGNFAEDMLKVTGKGNVSIEGFGIKAPGAEGIFEVQDDVELSFSIEAQTKNSEDDTTTQLDIDNENTPNTQDTE